MSEDKNRKRNLSQGDDHDSRKRRSICLEDEINTESSNMIIDCVNDEKAQSKMAIETEVQEVKEENESPTSATLLNDKNSLDSLDKMASDVPTDIKTFSDKKAPCTSSSSSKKGMVKVKPNKIICLFPATQSTLVFCACLP